MKKILITGGLGFIFSNFIRKAIYQKHPYTFVNIDKANNKKSIQDRYINRNHKFYLCDIVDHNLVDTIFMIEKPDIVIHAAALTHVDNSLKDPSAFILNNVVGTQNIIDSCLKYNVDKMIYIETDEAYGHLTNESDALFTEKSPVNPRNPYSASKVSGGLLVKAAHESFGLKYNITRASNNYGVRQTSDKLIPKVIKCILNNKPIPVYGKGLQIRDWLHVEDNCSAIMTILNNGKDNEIYNISANQELSNIEVVQKICNIMGKGHNLISHIEDRPGHDFRYAIDSSKLKELRWQPEHKFKDSIEEVIGWYVLNKNWAL